MSGTDGDGYQSAWRADHAGDLPTGDPWAAPMSRSTVPDALSPDAADGTAWPGDETAAVVSLNPSTSDHPTAPWPFVTSRAEFPDAEFSPADEFPLAAELPDIAELPDVAELPDAADALSPPWPGDLGAPVPPPFWPPTDPAHESAPGVWTPPPPTFAQPTPPAWPQQSAPPSWPPLPDTSGGQGAASILERRAPSSEVRPSAPESASAVSAGPSGWAYATDVAAPGVYVPGAPPPWPEQHAQSAGPSVSRSVSPAQSPVWPQSTASGTTGYGPGGGSDPGTGRSRRRGVIALVVLIAVVVFSVVGVAIGTRSHGPAKAQTPSAARPSAGGSRGPLPSGSTSAGTTVDSVPLGDGQALIRKIVPTPTGAHAYDVGDSSAGVMDLDQYARHYFNGDATELNRLRKEGFRVAASTDYVRSDGIEIATHLVQFASATGAEDYFGVEKSAWTADDRVTAGFEVPATSDAIGYELSKVDSLGNRRSVMYEHVANVVVVVNIYTSRKIDRAVDIKVLQAQLAALS